MLAERFAAWYRYLTAPSDTRKYHHPDVVVEVVHLTRDNGNQIVWARFDPPISG
ncbi:MAG: hypothetical protein UX31_C0014G0002 [Candidatus Nomurabacteria bacterium GW2011_GWA1_46_11]|uniref:Uncharacterized protein n=1 Tax=Candidatus Nomurabacteria bacterium GW2011_GWA1_46_11 TaxID=1618732 RepID=A0A0G1NMP8_9BACT|nr:MAG: hypothetical protein UW73_C0017G0002 [Microgenomates group bacterium GW2011_GWB1_44_8]KKU21706.1 MAG: hypothetical protein UX31_C0014G0002 [Candidatus Nomurabacteria bacterium GW2011_GWA1_46_11]